MRIGSLFSGYGGLDHAVEAVTGGETVWVSDIDPGANKILAHHRPGVPNLGDISAVDWAAVEPVDVITGGFPCQDVSMAGRRLGMRAGTRSGLWSMMAAAIAGLHPAMVVIENVRGLLSADGHADVEPCPWCMGDTGDEPALRALGGVLGDLADLGYDAAWQGLPASRIGAPHQRFRVFIVAWPSAPNTAHDDRDGGANPGTASGGAGFTPPDTDDQGREVSPGGRFDAVTLLPTPTVSDTNGAGAHGTGGLDLRTAITFLPTPTGSRYGNNQSPSAGVAVRPSLDTLGTRTDWGTYAPAVHRWESLTRPAPPPTEPGPRGGQRLSPMFVEWMMGLPSGHVTDPAIGLTRNEQLKALGNGVVPQQAEHAIRHILSVI